jgi:hypothetical protein
MKRNPRYFAVPGSFTRDSQLKDLLPVRPFEPLDAGLVAFRVNHDRWPINARLGSVIILEAAGTVDRPSFELVAIARPHVKFGVAAVA